MWNYNVPYYNVNNKAKKNLTLNKHYRCTAMALYPDSSWESPGLECTQRPFQTLDIYAWSPQVSHVGINVTHTRKSVT